MTVPNGFLWTSEAARLPLNLNNTKHCPGVRVKRAWEWAGCRVVSLIHVTCLCAVRLIQVYHAEEHPPVVDVEGQQVDRPLRETGKFVNSDALQRCTAVETQRWSTR